MVTGPVCGRKCLKIGFSSHEVALLAGELQCWRRCAALPVCRRTLQCYHSIPGDVPLQAPCGACGVVDQAFPVVVTLAALQLVFEIGKLYHPNISQVDGRVCEDMLSKSWGPTKRVTDIIHLIEEFMANPNFGV